MKKVTEKQNRNKQTNKDKVKKQLAQQYFALQKINGCMPSVSPFSSPQRHLKKKNPCFGKIMTPRDDISKYEKKPN